MWYHRKHQKTLTNFKRIWMLFPYLHCGPPSLETLAPNAKGFQALSCHAISWGNGATWSCPKHHHAGHVGRKWARCFFLWQLASHVFLKRNLSSYNERTQRTMMNRELIFDEQQFHRSQVPHNWCSCHMHLQGKNSSKYHTESWKKEAGQKKQQHLW